MSKALEPGWYVSIICAETKEVEKRMGPMSESKAEKVERGVDLRIDLERFYSQVDHVSKKVK